MIFCKSRVEVAMPPHAQVLQPDLDPPADRDLAVMFAVPIPYLVPIVQAGQIVLVPADRMG
ncbi:MAG: hypothetical protein WDZ51_13605 [Pirellulaceae bacterium]